MTAQNLVNTPDNRLVVAVDGPSGVGKSTLCRAVAKHFGAQYFDTGAMYRAATLAVLRAGVNPAERAAVIAATNNLNITLDDQTVLLDGEDVSEEIRSQEVTRMVSAVSAIPEVRATLIAQQREWASTTPRCIFDGRDMGTNVLPDAPLKVFLTACHKVRAQRRYEQIIASGGHTIYEVVLPTSSSGTLRIPCGPWTRSTRRMTPSSLTPPTCHCRKPSIRLFPSWKNQPKGAPHK